MARSPCRREIQRRKTHVKEASERHIYKFREPRIVGGHLEIGEKEKQKGSVNCEERRNRKHEGGKWHPGVSTLPCLVRS